MEVSFFAPSYINCLGNKIYVVLLEEDPFCSQYVTDKNSSCDKKKKKCYYRNCGTSRNVIGRYTYLKCVGGHTNFRAENSKVLHHYIKQQICYG